MCMHSCICVEKSGKGLVIFGQAKRGAVTACGLGTEGPVFWMQREESRGEERGVRSEEWFHCGCPVAPQAVYELLLA